MSRQSAYEKLILEVSGTEINTLCEDHAISLPSEQHLQALWFAGQLGRDFTTVDEKNVRVIQFGHWNHSAGPDFLHASVEIEGTLHKGAIELDHRAGDWETHGHAQNENFDQVVLHVVFCHDHAHSYTRNTEHREIPRVVVSEKTLREALNMPLLAMANADRKSVV